DKAVRVGGLIDPAEIHQSGWLHDRSVNPKGSHLSAGILPGPARKTQRRLARRAGIPGILEGEERVMITSPVIVEEVRAEVDGASESQQAQARRNSDWLQAHWSELLPQAFGKFLAVAGQQAFVADSLEEVVALAQATHPEDKGMLVE